MECTSLAADQWETAIDELKKRETVAHAKASWQKSRILILHLVSRIQEKGIIFRQAQFVL